MDLIELRKVRPLYALNIGLRTLVNNKQCSAELLKSDNDVYFTLVFLVPVGLPLQILDLDLDRTKWTLALFCFL